MRFSVIPGKVGFFTLLMMTYYNTRRQEISEYDAVSSISSVRFSTSLTLYPLTRIPKPWAHVRLMRKRNRGVNWLSSTFVSAYTATERKEWYRKVELAGSIPFRKKYGIVMLGFYSSVIYTVLMKTNTKAGNICIIL